LNFEFCSNGRLSSITGEKMLTPTMLHTRFSESYAQISQAIAPISEADSLRQLLPDINPLHWLLGHVVVARVNFLTLLAEPSIWPWEICQWFIPGSVPAAETATAITWAVLRLDLDRSQELLTAALRRTTADDLTALRDGRPIGDHLLEYATHEAYHAGQIAVLRQVLRANNETTGVLY
jgi:uncharacterized damage-inducible protein DinB